MVEEAAGTRMYEAKKQAAQKTIEKKDAKLRELNDVGILFTTLVFLEVMVDWGLGKMRFHLHFRPVYGGFTIWRKHIAN